MSSILSLILFASLILPFATSYSVHFLEQGSKFEHKGKLQKFNIYCYSGRPKYLIHLWQSAFFEIQHPTDEYEYYDGATPEEVEKEYEEHRHSWNFINLFTSKQKQLTIDPFNGSCIGIESAREYSINLQIIRIDYWKVLCLVIGLSLFMSADKLSSNTLFYYLSGISLGICLSFLILIYFISKIFPKKPIMYGVAACGWTVGIYVLQLLWDNIRVILLNYKIYVLWYVAITGLVSFIVCYRWGPIENERSKNLIRWTLQLLALVAIFFSTQFQEAAMGQIVVLLLFHNIPPAWLTKSQKYWKKRFPPKVKLLTNDEYYEEGVRETTKALEGLRQYCSSPNCKQWDIALKLKDVKRFASFIEGNSHLSDEEILEYETTIQSTELTDDDNSDEYTEEEN